MNSRRRPYVRTLIVGSALALTGCSVSTNPAPPEPDTTEGQPDAATPVEDAGVSINPPIDALDEPTEDAQGPEPELPPVAENPAPEPEE